MVLTCGGDGSGDPLTEVRRLVLSAVRARGITAVTARGHRRRMSAAPSPSLTPTPPRRSAAAQRWNDDWDHFASSPAAAAALARWRDDPYLAAPHMAALLAAAGASGAYEATGASADAVLGRLVARAPDDGVAARVVLQRVLPGLVAAARRRSRAEPRAMAQALDDLVSTAWTVIVTYPLERRPAKFAANIVRDTEYLCFVRARRLRHVVEILNGSADDATDGARAAIDGRPECVDINASEAVDVLLATAEQRGLSGDDLQLLRALYVEDCGVDDVAGEHDIGARALRYRRAAAIRRLARLAA